MLTTKTCVTQLLFYAWGIHCVDDENTNDKNGNDKKTNEKGMRTTKNYLLKG